MATGELGWQNLSRALAGLSAALSLDTSGYPEFVRDVIDSGRIQKFEYCAELFWKHLRSSLLAEGLDVPNSPRAAIKAGRVGPGSPDLCFEFKDGSCTQADKCNAFHLCWHCWCKMDKPYEESGHKYDDCPSKSMFQKVFKRKQ